MSSSVESHMDKQISEHMFQSVISSLKTHFLAFVASLCHNSAMVKHGTK